MAVKPTIYKAELDISNIDSAYYETHALTIACHPSETTERMMLRILAFALNASERLEFGADIGDTDEPALWRRDLTGAVTLWIELGMPDEKKIMRICGRAAECILYAKGRAADVWWSKTGTLVERAKNLSVYRVSDKSAEELAKIAERTMKLHCLVQEGEVSLGNESVSVQLELVKLR